MILFLLVVLLVTIGITAYVLPGINHAFSHIWTDPSERQRAAIQQRLKELHTQDGIPEETAVLMATKEFQAKDEAALLKLAQCFDAADVRNLATGRRSLWSTIVYGLDRAIKKGTRGSA